MIKINEIYLSSAETFLASIPNEFVDLTVTSPPYDNLRKYDRVPTINIKLISDQLLRATKPGGVLVWVVGDQTKDGSETGNSFRHALAFLDSGWRLHDTMIYEKKNFVPLTHRRYEQAFEYMFIFSKGAPKTFNPIMIDCKTAGDKYNLKKKGANVEEGNYRRRDENIEVGTKKIKHNIWQYACGSSKTKHPAPFPAQLAIDHVLSWSNPGDVVADIFSGSGTTARACIKTGRNYTGSEISEKYWLEGNELIQAVKA